MTELTLFGLKTIRVTAAAQAMYLSSPVSSYILSLFLILSAAKSVLHSDTTIRFTLTKVRQPFQVQIKLRRCRRAGFFNTAQIGHMNGEDALMKCHIMERNPPLILTNPDANRDAVGAIQYWFAICLFALKYTSTSTPESFLTYVRGLAGCPRCGRFDVYMSKSLRYRENALRSPARESSLSPSELH